MNVQKQLVDSFCKVDSVGIQLAYAVCTSVREFFQIFVVVFCVAQSHDDYSDVNDINKQRQRNP